MDDQQRLTKIISDAVTGEVQYVPETDADVADRVRRQAINAEMKLEEAKAEAALAQAKELIAALPDADTIASAKSVAQLAGHVQALSKVVAAMAVQMRLAD